MPKKKSGQVDHLGGDNDLEKSTDIDLEDGEILDSGEEAENSGVPQKRPKRKKKKKKRTGEQHGKLESGHSPSKKKRKHADHDRGNPEDVLQETGFGAKKRRHHGGKSHGPVHHMLPKKPIVEIKRRPEVIIRYNKAEDMEQDFQANEDEMYFSDDQGSDDGMQQNFSRRPMRGGMRGGKRRRGGRGGRMGRRPVPEMNFKKLICKFFLEGKCFKGDECTYSHDSTQVKKRELCKFYVFGDCRSGNTCLFMHEQFPCKFFHTGAKCYSDENCKFSHDRLTEEGRSLLAKCLHSGKGESKGGDFNDEPHGGGKRPSLLGTPPKSMKLFGGQFDEDDDEWDAQMPHGHRPNFYNNVDEEEANDDYGNHTPVNSEGHCDSWDGDGDGDEEVEMPNNAPEASSDVPPEGGSRRSKSETSENESQKETEHEESSPEPKNTVPRDIPSHLPKRQRELFLRIQQQQREAEALEEETSKAKDEEEKEENWYSDDDEEEEEEGDQPLTAVLKKLQQQPTEVKESSAAPKFDISSMISAIRNQSSQASSDESSANMSNDDSAPNRNKVRDPRLARESKANSERTLKPRAKDEYYLVPVNTSVPGDYNKYAIVSQSQERLQKDPRIKKLIEKVGSIELIIREEERKIAPKLPDFVPPPNMRNIAEATMKPNYSKGVDPRTGRRPPLLPPPMPGAELTMERMQVPPFTTAPPRPPIARPDLCNQWAPNQQAFNHRMAMPPGNMMPKSPRMNFPVGMPNQRGPFLNNPRFGMEPMPGTGPMMLRDPRTTNVIANRDPRAANSPNNRDPRNMAAMPHIEPLIPDLMQNCDPRGLDIRPPIRDPRGLSRDPRSKEGDGPTRLNPESHCSPTAVIDPNVKNMFRAIDPTASPFC